MADVSDPPRFTSAELVTEGRLQGLSPTPRLIRDWTEKGLLGAPQRRWLGRARGSQAWWSAGQKDMFNDLLRARQHDSSVRDAALARLPVLIWLQPGNGPVSIVQVRRALATWVAGIGQQPKSRSAAAGTSIASSLASQTAAARPRRRFAEYVAGIQHEGTAEKHRLVDVATRAIDTTPGQLRGPEGAPLSGAIFAELIDRRLRLVKRLARTSDRNAPSHLEIPDSDFEQARQYWRYVSADYLGEQAYFARDPDTGHLFAEWTGSEQMTQACNSFVDCLGMIIYGEIRGGEGANLR